MCGECFATLTTLKRHIKRTHSTVKTETSEDGSCFSISELLSQRKKTKTGKKRFECDQCGKCFKTATTLKKHKTKHVVVKQEASDDDNCVSIPEILRDIRKNKRK